MLSRRAFDVLKDAICHEDESSSAMPGSCGAIGFGDLESALLELREGGYLEGFNPSPKGLKAMEQYRVRNAIILAAGGVAKNSKSIYSLPKGLYVRDGETLIERQIRQLKEAGVDDVTVVVGYRQELFFFLEDKWDVSLVCSPSPSHGNVVSLSAVSDRLGRTYVCYCDQYYADNPFSSYEYAPYHVTAFLENASHETKVRTNRDGRIVGLYTDSDSGECLYGHAFLDEASSERLRGFMKEELDVFGVDRMFWEELALRRHAEDFDIEARRFDHGAVLEFDTIAETQSMETLFINDVGDTIERKICGALGCLPCEIEAIELKDLGMTNVNFTFNVRGERYMFRYPGESSSELVDRRRECRAQRIATDLGLDGSCVYIDEDGCKISRYRENASDLSGTWFGSRELIGEAVRKMRGLHDATRSLHLDDMGFDAIAEGDRLMALAGARKGDLSSCFGDLRADCAEAQQYVEGDGWERALCHLDWKYDNVLVTGDTCDVIDWEYGSFCDPGYDLLRILMGYEMGGSRYREVIDEYLGHEATEAEYMHLTVAQAPVCWYWLGWLMYQESLGEECGSWTLQYWHQARAAIREALPYYRRKCGGEQGRA